MYSRNMYHATWNNKTVSWYCFFSIHLLQQTGVEPTKEAVEAGRAYEQMLLVVSSRVFGVNKPTSSYDFWKGKVTLSPPQTNSKMQSI